MASTNKKPFGGNKGRRSAAAIAPRRNKVAALVAEGKTVVAIARDLGTPLRTVTNDLTHLRGSLLADSRETWESYRVTARRDFVDMIEATDKIRDTERRINARLAVWDRLTRLDGLNAPTKSLSMSVDASDNPDKLIGYRKFVYETRFLYADQLEQVFAFCRTLNKPPARIDHQPPATSELWDEPKQLTEGESECDS
jgi:hypothetical protein